MNYQFFTQKKTGTPQNKPIPKPQKPSGQLFESPTKSLVTGPNLAQHMLLLVTASLIATTIAAI